MHFGASFWTTIALPDGIYDVSLAFIEPTVGGFKQRVFDVTINDQPVLVNLDIWGWAGWMKPLYRRVIVAVQGGTMRIDFRATVRSAVVSGITIEKLNL